MELKSESEILSLGFLPQVHDCIFFKMSIHYDYFIIKWLSLLSAVAQQATF